MKTRPLPDPYIRPAAPEVGTTLLDGNEGARPDRELRDALAHEVAPFDSESFATLYRDYPSREPLRRDLARRFGIEPARVAVTAGADGAIDRLFRAFLQPGDEVLTALPTFEMFPRFAALAGASLRGVIRDGAFPVDALIANAGPRTRVALLVSPNNPSGEVARAADLEVLARALPEVLILLDHVYVEYAEEDLTGRALGLDNVVVVRTFSKARGLAGCRVGYALGAESAIAALEVAGDPYPVSGPSLAAARVSLARGDGRLRDHVARVRSHRSRLLERLAEWGLPCPPSQANFVLPWFGADRDRVFSALLEQRLLVRRFSNRPELLGALRITVPEDPATFERLVAALGEILQNGSSR